MKSGVLTAEGFDSDGRRACTLIANQILEVLFDTAYSFSNAFFCQIPHFRIPGGPLLGFGLECRRCDHQQILADRLDSVLPTLIVLKRLPIKEHDVENCPREPTTRSFHEEQFGADFWMLTESI